jgi:hypothetical protein
MPRHQFAHVLPAAGRAGGFVLVSEDGSASFHPAARATAAERAAAAWATRTPGMSEARIEASHRFGPLDWHDVPDDEADPVAWASLRAALALTRGGVGDLSRDR